MDTKDIDIHADSVSLTFALMQKAQKSLLSGPDKKKLVLEAFEKIGPQDRKGIDFKNDVLRVLIDTLKFAARGGLELAVKTSCFGLFK